MPCAHSPSPHAAGTPQRQGILGAASCWIDGLLPRLQLRPDSMARSVDGLVAGALGAEDAVDRVVFGPGHPKPVLGLDRGLPGDVVAPEPFVGRQPRRGVTVALRGIGWPVDGQEVERVVGEVQPLLGAQELGTLLPGIRERDHVVDLDQGTGPLSADKVDRLSGERIPEDPGGDDAAVRPGYRGLLQQVPAQDVVACVASIAVRVLPPGPEEVPIVPGPRCPALDRDARQLRQRGPVSGCCVRWRGRRGRGCAPGRG